MTKKIFDGIFYITLAAIMLCFALVLIVVNSHFEGRYREYIEDEAKAVALAIEMNGADYLDALDSERRVTLISSDGSVLFDNKVDASTLDDHSERAEIIEAMANGVGRSERYSSTIARKTYNVAVKLSDSSVIRLSDSEHSVFSLAYGMVQPICLILVLLIASAAVCSLKISESIIKPINAIDLEHPAGGAKYEELKPIMERLESQREQISRQMEQIERDHLDRERIRREFTANVSHELKTPLTSISGFAELMRDGVVDEADVPGFAGRIYSEAQRLITLVGDIIKLSRLDDSDTPVVREDVDLYSASEAIISEISPAADQRGITVSLDGEHAETFGCRQIIDEMIYNLLDNAVKYNTEGGSVTIETHMRNDCAEISVADTGIGIPRDEQERVFERFYRVDKNHSRAIGGTGLGLSIVKHGASFHNAKVTLASEPGVGTRVTISFPKAPLTGEI